MNKKPRFIVHCDANKNRIKPNNKKCYYCSRGFDYHDELVYDTEREEYIHRECLDKHIELWEKVLSSFKKEEVGVQNADN